MWVVATKRTNGWWIAGACEAELNGTSYRLLPNKLNKGPRTNPANLKATRAEGMNGTWGMLVPRIPRDPRLTSLTQVIGVLPERTKELPKKQNGNRQYPNKQTTCPHGGIQCSCGDRIRNVEEFDEEERVELLRR